MNKRFAFDEDYYQRYYRDPSTCAVSREEALRTGDFVCAYLRYMNVTVRSALDIGCGLGYWREILSQHFVGAEYTGVEVSGYLCDQYGWTRGSVVDFRSRKRFDLVICHDVLQYLSKPDAKKAIDNLGGLCRGVLYFGALTCEDWEEHSDRARTDGSGYLRPARWYRRRLAEHFINAGGGVFVSRESPIVLWELEQLPAK